MKAKLVRFLFGTIALVVFLVGPVIAVSGCAALAAGSKRAERPAKYAEALASCEASSPAGPDGWRTYVPCCFAAADRFARPRTDCADGGAE